MVEPQVLVVVAGLGAAAALPPVERAARRLLKVRDRVWARALLALSWLGSAVLVVVAAFLLDVRSFSPFVWLSGLFHYALFGLVHPREAVFAETRRENRWGIGGVYPYYLTRDAVGLDRVFAKWAVSALLAWAAMAGTLFLLLGAAVGASG